MDNENKWEYDYSSQDKHESGDTGYPNVGSSGMNTANTARTDYSGYGASPYPQQDPNGYTSSFSSGSLAGFVLFHRHHHDGGGGFGSLHLDGEVLF